MAFVSHNALWLSRSLSNNPSIDFDSFIRASAYGNVSLASVGQAVNVTALTEVTLGTASAPEMLRVGNGFIRAVADGDVTLSSVGGSVNIESQGVVRIGGSTIAVNASALDIRSGEVLVNDTVVTLASRDTAAETTASVVHGAGVLAGMGGDRSIRWSRGHSELPLNRTEEVVMAGARSNVGCWDVRGGGIRLIAETSNMEVAYGFRINKLMELEIYRRDIDVDSTTSNVAQFRRVSCFGGALRLASRTSLLPTRIALLPTSPAL
jgi:hypothetical protein